MVGGFDALSIGSPKSGMNDGLLKTKNQEKKLAGRHSYGVSRRPYLIPQYKAEEQVARDV